MKYLYGFKVLNETKIDGKTVLRSYVEQPAAINYTEGKLIKPKYGPLFVFKATESGVKTMLDYANSESLLFSAVPYLVKYTLYHDQVDLIYSAFQLDLWGDDDHIREFWTEQESGCLTYDGDLHWIVSDMRTYNDFAESLRLVSRIDVEKYKGETYEYILQDVLPNKKRTV